MMTGRWTVRAAVAATVLLSIPVILAGSAAGVGTAAPVTTAVPPDQLQVTATQVAFGLQRPTAITAPNDGSGRLFIVEKQGTVRVYHPDTGLAAGTLLDIRDRVDVSGNERGLLGIVASPNFATNPALYVAYTALPAGTLTLSRFPLAAPGQSPVPPTGEQILLTQAHAEFSNHNGGQLAFDANGLLYWSLGDGGGSDDVLGNGQRLSTLLGKILRLDVSRACAPRPYCIPAGNPFVTTPGARPEIWAYGLRNPWRFSFDAVDGSLWIADVGQGRYEEVNHIPGNLAGANFGWSCREGPVVFDASRCVAGATYIDPVFSYRTSFEGCAVIGGHVYRGRQFADVAAGTYLVSDYCSASMWALRPGAAGQPYASALLGELPLVQPTTFGVDAAGELYLANDLPGQLYKLSFQAVRPAAACSVTYRVESQWRNGFTASVAITNTGTAPIAGWTLGWAFTGNQRFSNGWNATVSQQGTAVSARDVGWNSTIAPGASVTFGFQGTHTGSNPPPAAFTLNGAACR